MRRSRITPPMTPLLESFLFGLVNSLHCAGMCGPLALSLGGGAWTYQAGRLISYGTLGVVVGSLGRGLGSGELGTPSAWVAFALALGLLMLALVGDASSIRIPVVSRWLARGVAAARALPARRRGAVVGLLTPLLPCGLLWAAVAAAALSGSWLGGAQVMVGFALGAVPLLSLAQGLALHRRLSPLALARIRRGAMLLAAAALIWRGAHALGSGSCCG
ncbi:MAG: sulfite exporter TauE/SafE family protein [Planctomycetota bacterium]